MLVFEFTPRRTVLKLLKHQGTREEISVMSLLLQLQLSLG